MDIVLLSLKSTTELIFRMGPVMFISLFGIELLMQKGLMRYLKPIGKPVARIANLPSESAVCFLSAIGSMIAAHTIAAGYYEDRKMTKKELILTGVLNTVPFHFKETLTYQLPIVLPLLGIRLCLIYIAAFWLTGVIKLFYVIAWGRLFIPKTDRSDDAFSLNECDPMDPDCVPRTLKEVLKDTWNTRKKMFIRMITLLVSVTFLVQILLESGLLSWFETLIVPLTTFFNLPASVVVPISAYTFSPTVGITSMSNLLNQVIVTPYQAIVSLMAGSLLMIPVTRLRRTLPRYTSIYGVKNGMVIGGLTAAISMIARVLILIWLIIYKPV